MEGAPTGTWQTLGTESLTMATNTAQRLTKKYPVTAGRYEVRARRLDDKDTSALKLGILDCAAELKMTNADLAKLISDGYENDVAAWTYGAPGVLFGQLHKVCRGHIDAKRKAAGLPSLPAAK